MPSTIFTASLKTRALGLCCARSPSAISRSCRLLFCAAQVAKKRMRVSSVTFSSTLASFARSFCCTRSAACSAQCSCSSGGRRSIAIVFQSCSMIRRRAAGSGVTGTIQGFSVTSGLAARRQRRRAFGERGVTRAPGWYRSTPSSECTVTVRSVCGASSSTKSMTTPASLRRCRRMMRPRRCW